MTTTQETKFQMMVLTAQGSWVRYGKLKTTEQCNEIRRTSHGFEGQHYRFEAI